MKRFIVVSNHKDLAEILPNLCKAFPEAQCRRFNSGNGDLVFRLEHDLFVISLTGFYQIPVDMDLDGIVFADGAMNHDWVSILLINLKKKRGWIYTPEEFEKYALYGDHIKVGGLLND